jgi:SAM-dependent methyltransferase
MSVEHRTSCPACATADHEVVAELSYRHPVLAAVLDLYAATPAQRALLDAERYALLACAGCGTLYQRTVPGPALAYALYEEWIDAARSLALAQDTTLERLRRGLYVLEGMVKLLRAPWHGAACVDFGAGWGSFSALARAAGLDVTACELSPSRAAHLRALGIRVRDIGAVASQSVALVHCDQVLEHVTQPREVVAELARVLAPGGVLFVGLPHDPEIGRRLRREAWLEDKFYWKAGHPRVAESLNAVAPLEHVNTFSGLGLERLLAAVGLVPFIPPAAADAAPAGPHDPARPVAAPGGASPRDAPSLDWPVPTRRYWRKPA